jgi:hypothetical protein
MPPAAQFISSPYDADAHYARKYTMQWVGYEVHLTETCEDDLPHLITHVETTSGPVADGAAPPTIHAALQQWDPCPGPISWTPASWMPNSSLIVGTTMASICWGRHASIITGTPARAPALMSSTSRSIGTSRRMLPRDGTDQDPDYPICPADGRRLSRITR